MVEHVEVEDVSTKVERVDRERTSLEMWGGDVEVMLACRKRLN